MRISITYTSLQTRAIKVLYIGVTNDLDRRVSEHKDKVVEGFTKKYNLTKVVYYEITEDIQSALAREKQLKNWHREWKNNLINESNPSWRDLSQDSWARDAETSSA